MDDDDGSKGFTAAAPSSQRRSALAMPESTTVPGLMG